MFDASRWAAGIIFPDTPWHLHPRQMCTALRSAQYRGAKPSGVPAADCSGDGRQLLYHHSRLNWPVPYPRRHRPRRARARQGNTCTAQKGGCNYSPAISRKKMGGYRELNGRQPFRFPLSQGRFTEQEVEFPPGSRFPSVCLWGHPPVLESPLVVRWEVELPWVRLLIRPGAR